MPLMGGFIAACLVASIVLVTGGITAVAPASSAGASSSTLYVSTNGANGPRSSDRAHVITDDLAGATTVKEL